MTQRFENGILEKITFLFPHFVAYLNCQTQVDLKWQKVDDDDGMINAIYDSILFSLFVKKNENGKYLKNVKQSKCDTLTDNPEIANISNCIIGSV